MILLEKLINTAFPMSYNTQSSSEPVIQKLCFGHIGEVEGHFAVLLEGAKQRIIWSLSGQSERTKSPFNWLGIPLFIFLMKSTWDSDVNID